MSVLHILRNPSDPNALKVIHAQQAQGTSPVVAVLGRPPARELDGGAYVVCEKSTLCDHMPAGARPMSWGGLVEKIFATDATVIW